MSGKTNNNNGWNRRFEAGSGTRGVFAVILHGERLLISEWRDCLTWNLAGGGVNPGETDEEALKREVLDETGLEVRLHVAVGGERSQGIDTIQLYLCTITGGALMATRESRLHRWVTAADIGDVPWAGGGVKGRHARMAWDGLSLLQSPSFVSRPKKPLLGAIEERGTKLWFQLPGGKALRWERLAIIP